MIFAFALTTALREFEICALNVRDVMHGQKPRNYLLLEAYKGRGKTKKPTEAERVPLNRQLRRKLIKFMAWKKRRGEPVGPDAALFVSKRLKVSGEYERIATRTLRYNSRQWQLKAGIDRPYHFHSFRHACLTNAYQETKNILFVQQLARHKDMKITQIYTHLSDEQMSREVDRLPV